MQNSKLKAIERWHEVMSSESAEGLYDLLTHDCKFWSPIVHTPQCGRRLTMIYLSAAHKVFNTDFRYVREIISEDTAVLEFECTIDSIEINGIDMIHVQGDQISEFKVMVRPLRAIEIIHKKMMVMLEELNPSYADKE